MTCSFWARVIPAFWLSPLFILYALYWFSIIENCYYTINNMYWINDDTPLSFYQNTIKLVFWLKICDFDSVHIYKSAHAKKAFLCVVQGFWTFMFKTLALKQFKNRNNVWWFLCFWIVQQILYKAYLIFTIKKTKNTTNKKEPIPAVKVGYGQRFKTWMPNTAFKQ